MTRKSRDIMAALEAEKLIQELKIDSLPIDPAKIAQSLGLVVQPKSTKDGVSGMLIRMGNEFDISYATHIKSEGFKRFCIAHEIGHFRCCENRWASHDKGKYYPAISTSYKTTSTPPPGTS